MMTGEKEVEHKPEEDMLSSPQPKPLSMGPIALTAPGGGINMNGEVQLSTHQDSASASSTSSPVPTETTDPQQ